MALRSSGLTFEPRTQPLSPVMNSSTPTWGESRISLPFVDIFSLCSGRSLSSALISLGMTILPRSSITASPIQAPIPSCFPHLINVARKLSSNVPVLMHDPGVPDSLQEPAQEPDKRSGWDRVPMRTASSVSNTGELYRSHPTPLGPAAASRGFVS